MGRAPCCEKSGLKKGPWTPEEDEKLVAYIKKNGQGNWRTLPKNAGERRPRPMRLCLTILLLLITYIYTQAYAYAHLDRSPWQGWRGAGRAAGCGGPTT
jgi:hypothetical protein